MCVGSCVDSALVMLEFLMAVSVNAALGRAGM